MKKILFNIITFITVILVGTNLYAANHLEHYIFHYESGNIYDVKIADSTFTWKGIAGSDKGKSEIEKVKRKKLSANVEVLQWSEKDGTFVTLILDRSSLNMISSLKSPDGSWFLSGKAYLS